MYVEKKGQEEEKRGEQKKSQLPTRRRYRNDVSRLSFFWLQRQNIKLHVIFFWFSSFSLFPLAEKKRNGGEGEREKRAIERGRERNILMEK